jgi:diguanylate cyclase (GGDEF)-like protein
MANFDAITGLPNRRYLMNYLKSISTDENKTKASFALLLIDLDNFKSVNDNAGHDAGDALLRHIAAYLDSAHENSKSFRPSAGMLNVSARIGGDEFVQIFPGVETETDAAIIAQKLLRNFSSQTLDRYIQKYSVGLSIGVAICPLHSDDFNVLIKYADLAMYHAKKAGKSAYRVYEDEMHDN